MKNIVYSAILFSMLVSLFGCYPEESDFIEVIDTEIPIDTFQISESFSKFFIDETEYRREGFAQYCALFDEVTGETTTEV